jgi:hypothetical protein
MNISDIKEWLSKPDDYQKGCDLLAQIETNKFRIFQLRLHECIDNNNHIIDALNEFIKKKETQTAAETGVYVSSDYNEAPEEIQRAVAEVKRIYKENNHLHSQLMRIKDDHERGIFANTILDNDDFARSLLDEIDYYKVHKKVKPKAEEAALNSISLSDLIQTISRLRTKISKLKRKKMDTSNEELKLQQLLDCKDRIS